MLSGHKKVKIILEMKIQDKTKSKRYDIAMQKKKKMIVGRHYCYKGHLFWKMFNVIWAFPRRHASQAPAPS